MFRSGDTIHVRTSSDIDRPLDPGVVIEGDSRRIAVRLDDPDLPLAVGQHVLILRTIDGAFTRQHAWVEAIMTGGGEATTGATVGFQTRGEPVTAEQRSTFRVSTAVSGRTASLDEESGCPLMDVSFGGLSVIAANQYAVGAEVDATLAFDGRYYRGRAIVRCYRVLGPDRIRYGLECARGPRVHNPLREGLRNMTATIQRQQLRRRARKSG